MSTYYELQPAYGRDYKTKAEVTQAWKDGKDFLILSYSVLNGDYQLGFKPVNIRDIPKPCTVMLRYRKNTMVTSLQVK